MPAGASTTFTVYVVPMVGAEKVHAGWVSLQALKPATIEKRMSEGMGFATRMDGRVASRHSPAQSARDGRARGATPRLACWHGRGFRIHALRRGRRPQ